MLHYLGYSRQPTDWEEELQWCTQHFRGRSSSSQLKKLTFNATIYSLWAERNNRLYEHLHCTGIELVKRICNDIRLKISAEDLVVDDNASNRQLFGRWNLDVKYKFMTPTICKWTRPPQGWFKINSDGSLQGTRGGYGAVIRNDEGVVIAACTGSSTGHSVIKHELQGVEAGLKLAQLHHITKLELTTDSTTLLDYLQKERSLAWDLRHIIKRIKDMLGMLEEYEISHAYRETNRVADRLASILPNNVFMEIIPSSFAEDLKDIVYEDRIGKTYLRM